MDEVLTALAKLVDAADRHNYATLDEDGDLVMVDEDLNVALVDAKEVLENNYEPEPLIAA